MIPDDPQGDQDQRDQDRRIAELCRRLGIECKPWFQSPALAGMGRWSQTDERTYAHLREIRAKLLDQLGEEDLSDG